MNMQRLSGFKALTRALPKSMGGTWALPDCVSQKEHHCGDEGSRLCSPSLVSQKAEATSCPLENQWFSKLISVCHCNWILKKASCKTFLKVSKLENCAVTEHKSNTSNFDILIANKEKISHYRTEPSWLIVNQTLQRTIPSPTPCSAAQQLKQQTSCKLRQPQPLLVILSPFKIALTHTLYFSNRCYRAAKSLSRRKKKPTTELHEKNKFRSTIDLFAEGWIKIISGLFQWFTWIRQRRIWLAVLLESRGRGLSGCTRKYWGWGSVQLTSCSEYRYNFRSLI